ncbi:LOW QUALITY PROTEIN: hypothetical protein QYF61_000106 [Mycteria americana]|uniref:Rna-directed dna polymerase from mobile element jockey-like n=1 Tax=Mycteria americana TaxID=33587 RepID=A0AAN7RYK1_MYCAM|nr:LOW QUALITY PROTEIN: hypothetical protein QYF61_000106 [Mycteria americana]
MEPGSFHGCPDQRQWALTETREVPSEHQETLFTVKVTEHWNSLPREVVESLSLEILKSRLDIIPGNRRYWIILILESAKWSIAESMLGTVWFHIFINDLEERLSCTVIKFADDAKLGGNPPKGSTAIQSDRDSLEEYAYRNLMKLNKDKCNVPGLQMKEPLQWYRHCLVGEQLCWKGPGGVY